MPISESKKKANLKWDSANMATLACKVKKDQAERFKAYCSDIGETVNAVLQSYVNECVAGGGAQPAASPQECASAAEAILMPETLHKAQQAADLSGETVAAFVDRAVETQAQRDRFAQSMKQAEKRNNQEGGAHG